MRHINMLAGFCGPGSIDEMGYHDEIMSGISALEQTRAENFRRAKQAESAQIAMPALLSGAGMSYALQQAVNNLVAAVPEDHDVILQTFEINVLDVSFVEPHTFVFEGFDSEGHHTSIVCHFTQVVARVVCFPKRGPERVITGFGKQEA